MIDRKAPRNRPRDIVAGVERGREDLRNGRVIEHEAAMDELEAMVEAAARLAPRPYPL